MAQGGARIRSGPQPDPNSARSEARGYKLTALPAEGYTGPIPEWPLPDHTEREAELWAWAWTTPQACAWSLPSEQWRTQIVARWVQQAVKCEAKKSAASDHAQLHRYSDQVGLSTAGLREMGWKVAVDEVAGKAADRKDRAPARARRLQAVAGEE